MRGDVDIERLIDESGCAGMYRAVEECLAESGRDWRKCQREVREWKECEKASKAARRGELGGNAEPEGL